MRYLSVFTAFIIIIGVCSEDEDVKSSDVKSSSKNAEQGDWSGIENLAAVLYDLRDIKKDEEQICNSLKITEPSKMKINLTQPFDYDQMLTFLVWSMKHDFRSGKATKFSGDLEWKYEVVETLTTIFKKGCNTMHVPESFVNIIKAMFMVYINSLPSSSGKPSGGADRKTVWKPTLEMLKKCSVAETNLEMDTDGPFITEVGIPVGGKYGGYLGVPVDPQEEIVDSFDTLDLVIDTFWHIFSFSFGTCYPFMVNKAAESAQLKHSFSKDFLNDLTSRWREGGSPPMMYGPIFGDMDLMQAIINTRACVTAAYIDNEIDDRQLIRPLELTGHNDTMPIYNAGMGSFY